MGIASMTFSRPDAYSSIYRPTLMT